MRSKPICKACLASSSAFIFSLLSPRTEHFDRLHIPLQFQQHLSLVSFLQCRDDALIAWLVCRRQVGWQEQDMDWGVRYLTLTLTLTQKIGRKRKVDFRGDL